jgi:ADP-ribosylglycohydrolase
MNKIQLTQDTCKALLFGVALGDAMGVPVEFKNRETIRKSPVIDISGYGSYNLPPGTFSDDSSLTFCLAEALISGYSLNTIAKNFIKWRYSNFWTATGNVFDIGISTQEAIDRLKSGVRPDIAGNFDVYSNGNGSLMRIMPLLVYTINKPLDERYERTKEVSSITHGHIRSVIACFYYLEFAQCILQGIDKFETYNILQKRISDYLQFLKINQDEINVFNRLLIDQIDLLPETQISSTGYVLHTLEASIWCLLTTHNYREAVLKAVNLGEDTDTTGAVTGGLAGLLYGFENIPKDWLVKLARKNDIEDIAKRLYEMHK